MNVNPKKTKISGLPHFAFRLIGSLIPVPPGNATLLRLAGSGTSSREIAVVLGIARSTVQDNL
ncbi:hypothetical protein NKJ28_32540, partial [Mesorhizobium sp. M0145]|uniref:hypothetical protein n=1 Tax=Mesorhizobium sp. M0145 TaxID=2956895 RepID=UPI00333D608E